jgi:flagellar M-ring protein FliF
MEVVERPASDKVKEIIKDYGLFAVMLLLIVGLMVLAIPRKKREGYFGEAELQPVTVGGLKFAVPEPLDEPIPEISFEEKSEIKKQIDKFVKQKPEAVAQLLRNWISDDWND